MALNPIPRAREGITDSEMTWNEQFYTCLQKPLWIILSLILFAALIIFFSLKGQLRDIMDLIVFLLWSLGIIYLPLAMPASIIYATWKRAKYRN